MIAISQSTLLIFRLHGGGSQYTMENSDDMTEYAWLVDQRGNIRILLKIPSAYIGIPRKKELRGKEFD
jgi:hypothetical protein